MDDTIDGSELRLVVERARRHDPLAWDRLYHHCRPKLWRYARRRLSSDAAAEDALSEAFVRAITRIDGFTWEGAGFDAWMYGILRNVVLESYRRTARDGRILDEDLLGADPGRDHVGEVGDRLEAQEERDLVRRAFDRLGSTDREVLELRVVGGLSADAVAALLGKNPGAVRMAQSRALERLRASMKELGDG